MDRKLALGKVDPESYKDFMSALEAAFKQMEQIGLQELHGLKPDIEPVWISYKAMNGLGWIYGSALARAYTSELSPDDPELPRKINEVIDHLGMIYNDVEAKRVMLDDVVIRMAAEELPDYVPDWLNLDQVIAHAHASYQGKSVYFNDFYYTVMQVLNDITRALKYFLIADKRRENIVFRQEGAGGEYIPRALMDLSEYEERTLLKSIIRESNKKISERSWYCVRQEPLPPTGDFTILYWSNGPSVWFVDNRTDSAMIARDNGRGSIRLDANMVLVPFHQALVQKVVVALDDLPLYTYSVEAKERGDYPEPTTKNVQKALRSIVEAQNPGQDQEEYALMAAELFDLFVRARRYDRAAIAQARVILESQPVNLYPFVQLIEQWMRT